MVLFRPGLRILGEDGRDGRLNVCFLFFRLYIFADIIGKSVGQLADPDIGINRYRIGQFILTKRKDKKKGKCDEE